MIIIDEEYIDGIKMYNQIQFLFEERLISCTFNFNINEKWIESYLSFNQKIGIHQMNTALIALNGPIKIYEEKGGADFTKFKKLNGLMSNGNHYTHTKLEALK